MKNKIFDVVGIGELLIDFTQNSLSSAGNWIMEAHPGGGQPNTLAMLANLSRKTAFIGMLGNDIFYPYLIDALKQQNIDTSGVKQTHNADTTLAFVHTKADGDRDFSFYRRPGADTQLTSADINTNLIENTKILHFGTLSMTTEPANTATQHALSLANKHKVLRSFDPNLRIPLWDSLTHAKQKIIFGLQNCDILKISAEELEFITDIKNIEKAVALIQKTYNIKLITVTDGKNGSYGFWYDKNQNSTAFATAFTHLHTIDTTGAGDCFGACILHDILQSGFENITEKRLKSMLLFANAAAGLVTTRYGAFKSMPQLQEIHTILQNIIDID